MRIKLLRTYKDTHTEGRLLIHDIFVAYTLERKWCGNKVDLSCIKEGVYKCEKFIRKDRPAIRIHDVPGRTGILMHVGNSIRDTTGCILPGLTKADIPATVNHSERAMRIIDKLLPDEFEIEILKT